MKAKPHQDLFVCSLAHVALGKEKLNSGHEQVICYVDVAPEIYMKQNARMRKMCSA